MAISHFNDGAIFTPIELVLYGREFKIRTWIERGCTVIVIRDRTISNNTASKLGFNTTIELFRIRELRIRGNLVSETVILEALKDELDLVRRSELEYEDKALVGEESCGEEKS